MKYKVRHLSKEKNRPNCFVKLRQLTIFLLFLFAIFLQLFLSVQAENLPLKTYSSADGLANDNVNKIVADSRGFLWFCTEDGLSRFDGYRFKNYTQNQGLPHRNINDILETKDGDYLVATSGGLVVFNPNGKAFRWNIIEGKLDQNTNEPPIFRTFLTPESQNDSKMSKTITSLVEDGNGNIFAGTANSLYRVVKANNDWQLENVEFEGWNKKDHFFNLLFTDSKKDILIATDKAVFWMSKSGEIKEVNNTGSNNIFETNDGKVWIDSGGHHIGIRVYSFQNENAAPVLTATYSKKDGLPTTIFTTAVAETSDGRIFVSSDGILCEFLPNNKRGESKFRVFENIVRSSETDKSGNIWFITPGKGAARFSLNSFAVFDERDGLPKEVIDSIFGNDNGEVFLTMGKTKLVRASGEKFESLVPFGLGSRNWIRTFLDFQSSEGEFWIPSQSGLLRYPKVENFAGLSNTPPKKIYTVADGLFSNFVFNLFEDSRGDVWISTFKEGSFLLRFEKTTEKIYHYSIEDSVLNQVGAVSFGEDSSGNIWIGFYSGQIMRFKDGKFRSFTDENLIPRSYVNDMLSDKKGRFWLATANRGLFRVDNPNDESPVFSNFSTTNGLSSNQTMCLTEDNFGQLYVGTSRGINRLEPNNSQIKLYTTTAGLPGNIISQCYRDPTGDLWFSSNNSLIKLTPKADETSKAAPIFVDGINVNGTPRNISELGETAIENLELASNENQIQISFFAISFDSGETLRYQYKLEGQDWSDPSEQRIVDFNLSAGSYKFFVQAVNSDGVISENPSTIEFTILSPFYQRWWFLLVSFLLVSSILFVIYRRRMENLRRINSALTETHLAEENLRKSREERLAELQRVRLRIATDLHDDIGSSLTQISVFSELARQREAENGKAGEPLDMISNVADELVDTMSDIVWAINPKKDHLQDLTQRMRRFAADVLTAKSIEMRFIAPDSDQDIPLGANIRREVFLIFKETVNNIVKHSEAENAEILFKIENHFLEISIEDDGIGFEQVSKENGQQDWRKFRGGNGLLNMKKRAEDLGGSYEISSEIGKGTNVVLKIPQELKDER